VQSRGNGSRHGAPTSLLTPEQRSGILATNFTEQRSVHHPLLPNYGATKLVRGLKTNPLSEESAELASVGTRRGEPDDRVTPQTLVDMRLPGPRHVKHLPVSLSFGRLASADTNHWPAVILRIIPSGDP
jgi:hypothetical protein